MDRQAQAGDDPVYSVGDPYVERGFLTFWPDGTRPVVSNLNPAPSQPPTPNAVTTNLSGSGSFKVYNKAGTVDVIIDINGYYTKTSLQALVADVTALESGNADLQADVAALEARITALESLTDSLSIEMVDGQPTVRFTGVNVQVVDGSGDTGDVVNGKGKLIIGYNENVGHVRTGSHNLVVGPFHSYSGYGGFIAGYSNNVTGPDASVAGGSNNVASGVVASVSGGANRSAPNRHDWAAGPLLYED